jgi:hypothetical protein
MATEPNGIAALLTKLKSGQRFEPSPDDQKIIIGALERAVGGAMDDPPPRSGQPQPPKRMAPGESLFKDGPGAREQSVPEATDDADVDDAIAEIHEILTANNVPEQIITQCMRRIIDWAKGAQPGEIEHAVLKDNKIEHTFAADRAARLVGKLDLPRVHLMGSQAEPPHSRLTSARASALAERVSNRRRL